MCGAALKSTTVAMRVKRVKVSRHTRSSTIAAYFQSFTADTALTFRYYTIAIIGSILGTSYLDTSFSGNV